MPRIELALFATALLALTACGDSSGAVDSGVSTDTSVSDGDTGDSAMLDAGSDSDAGDGAAGDTGSSDTSIGDTSTGDASTGDTSTGDSGTSDGSIGDAGPADTGAPDTGPADCRVAGCTYGWCDAATGTCDTSASSYAVHHSWLFFPPLALHPDTDRVWAGVGTRNLLWADTTTIDGMLLPQPIGGFDTKSVAPTTNASGDLDWVMSRTFSSGPTEAGADIGPGPMSGRRHSIDLDYSAAPVTRARYVGADLYAVLVGQSQGSGSNAHEVNLLIESGGVLTRTVLPAASDTNLSISDVDFHVDASGHVTVLVVGRAGSPGAADAIAHLIAWDSATSTYRRRRFVLESGQVVVGGALDASGAPAVVVRDGAVTGQLAIHRFVGGSWVRENLPGRTRAGWQVTLAFTPSGRIAIALVGTDGSIEYVRETAPASWTTDVVPNPPFVALAGTSPRTFAYIRDVEMTFDASARPIFAFVGAAEAGSDPTARGTYIFVPLP